MKFTSALVATSLAALAAAAPSPESLPWAKANPQAAAAAQAYADAFAEAIAIGHADPESYALAASDDDCATIACHASCGMMIIAGEACSSNEEDPYEAPYLSGCLCGSADTDFLSYYDACMECGWTLWKYYSPYLTAALAECHSEDAAYSTEPTGTSRCSTTLTDSYTMDTSINYSSYL